MHRYIVLPFYPRTLKSHFQAYVDAIVAAPAEDSITALLPKEREVLLLMVQLCAALIHLQRHHVVHQDIKVYMRSTAAVRRWVISFLTHAHTAAQNDNIFIDADGRIKVADFGEVRQRCSLRCHHTHLPRQLY